MDDDNQSSLLTRNFFLVNIHGQIESSSFIGHDYENVYCKCLFRYGPDWALVNNTNSTSSDKRNNNKDIVFISQMASRRPDQPVELPLYVWNLPIEATFKSTNVFGWPQIIVSVYGMDNLGNDVIRGYGWTHLPIRPGEHRLQIRLFTPQSSTLLARIANWFVESRRPEFIDTRLAAGHEGRQLVTIENQGGEVTILLNVLFKDFKKYGFISR
ncbi:B9 domain-containing protein 1 [Dermatophagoides farinae]|uniref:B9 domain-containing protein 1 n=1 Tax=Dermatophagoides farinae TaxID=6954 RepID=A0A922LDG4_DERFA|nr:B9 domain-containing protein 1-like [Dermatophagoides farinae]XP_046910527.1 B9 domain-containing protein 1-like [Dermatophagoides farinae]KAH7642035.1 b9 domain-containing protein 1-like protein [Dermatophagoides farinae]KAH9529165.1 B9 domain-containing protein 1 [Dermatophagoides farinae]